MKNLPLIIIVMAVLAVVFYFFFMKKDTAPANTTGSAGSGKDTGDIDRMSYSKDDVILMGDQKVSWTNLYLIGEKMKLSRAQVESIVSKGRASFPTFASKNPAWEMDIYTIFSKAGIPFTN